jgi:hypothetical protein
VTRPFPSAERPDDADDDDHGSIPPWLWLILSCLVGVVTALTLLHLAGAARQLPG